MASGQALTGTIVSGGLWYDDTAGSPGQGAHSLSKRLPLPGEALIAPRLRPCERQAALTGAPGRPARGARCGRAMPPGGP